MIKEVAIDPRDLNRWHVYSLLVDDCGAEHGRLISDFPNGWRKMVLSACDGASGCGPVERKKIEYHLQHRVASRLWQRNRRYDHRQPWQENAAGEHGTRPFACVVTSKADGGEGFVSPELFDRSEPPWACPRQVNCGREPAELAALAAPLFEFSRKVRLVDPHFAPDRKRYTSSLSAFLSAMRRHNRSIGEVEFHLEAKTEMTGEAFKAGCDRHLRSIVPTGMRLQLVRWRQRDGGIDPHARYVLTDRTGLLFEAGLDAGAPGTRTDVVLLSEELRARHWAAFSRERPVVDGQLAERALILVDEFLIVGEG